MQVSIMVFKLEIGEIRFRLIRYIIFSPSAIGMTRAVLIPRHRADARNSCLLDVLNPLRTLISFLPGRKVDKTEAIANLV